MAKLRRRPLHLGDILLWATDHREHTGTWPTRASGDVRGAIGETWASIDRALRDGLRDLPGGSSLARLLAEHRGVRNRKQLPPLALEQILAWIDAHRQRTGAWPTRQSGPIPEAPGETWLAVDMALRSGLRELPGGSSLALLLAEHRSVRNGWTRPDLALEQILASADAYHERTGSWPKPTSGPIPEVPGETWAAVSHALARGSRGLPGGTSLAGLLAEYRGVRNQADLARLSRKKIRGWAIAYHERTGSWPTRDSGPIPECPGETWATVDGALQRGSRGLRGPSSLAQLLDECGAKRNLHDLPSLSYRKIVALADAHRERTGSWPNVNSGAVEGAPGERWDLIDNALRLGLRGLPGGSSLAQLLAKKRGMRNPMGLPALDPGQLALWAEAHFRRTGEWPRYDSGPIPEAPGETWRSVDYALVHGRRGLPGGSSLARFLAERGLRDGSQASHRGID